MNNRRLYIYMDYIWIVACIKVEILKETIERICRKIKYAKIYTLDVIQFISIIIR